MFICLLSEKRKIRDMYYMCECVKEEEPTKQKRVKGCIKLSMKKAHKKGNTLQNAISKSFSKQKKATLTHTITLQKTQAESMQSSGNNTATAYLVAHCGQPRGYVRARSVETHSFQHIYTGLSRRTSPIPEQEVL